MKELHDILDLCLAITEVDGYSSTMKVDGSIDVTIQVYQGGQLWMDEYIFYKHPKAQAELDRIISLLTSTLGQIKGE